MCESIHRIMGNRRKTFLQLLFACRETTTREIKRLDQKIHRLQCLFRLPKVCLKVFFFLMSISLAIKTHYYTIYLRRNQLNPSNLYATSL